MSYAETTLNTSPAAFDAQYARARALNLANSQQAYDFSNQQQADSALPAILMAMGQQQGPQAPMPGQSSMPQDAAPGPQIGPMNMPPGASPPPSAPGLNNTPSYAPTGFPSAGMPTVQRALQPQGGPQVARMDPGMAQKAQQQPPQQPSPDGNNGGYDIASFLQAVKQANPNISGGALRNILLTVNPLLFKPQEQMILAQLKAQTSRQNNMDNNNTRLQTTQMRDDTSTNNTNTRVNAQEDIVNKRLAAQQGAASLDPEDAKYLAQQYAQFGVQALTRLPAATRMAVIKAARENGTTPADIAQNIASNAGIRSSAVTTGKLNSNIGYASNEIEQLAPRIDELAQKIGQGNLKPFNTVGNLFKAQTNNTDLIALRDDLTDFINAQVRQSTGKSPTKAETDAFADTIDINMGAKGISAAVDEAVRQGKFAKAAIAKQKGTQSSGGNNGASNDPLGIR